MRIHFYLAAAALLIGACSSSTGPDPTGLPLGAASVQLDVAYCGTDDPAQRLDLYFPKRPLSTPVPLVLHIHGGGWSNGDKASGPWFVRVGEALLARGYVVASANYRLAPRNPWPAQIEDAACAVRHLRENASRYGIDPGRIGVWGNSAGGHLAAFLAVRGDPSRPGDESRVQAVVALYGIFDLTAADLPLGTTGFAIKGTFGSYPEAGQPELVAASPITHVSVDDPPFYLIHGRDDLVVPMSQSEAFFARLGQVGIVEQLLLVEHAGHELVPSGGTIRPSEEEITRRIVAFFDDRLTR